jgi:hypothetical protein
MLASTSKQRQTACVLAYTNELAYIRGKWTVKKSKKKNQQKS